MTTINYPMPAIEVKAPVISPNMAFSIRPTLP
jgi:hypothetical protein